jgi:hypothetical protein
MAAPKPGEEILNVSLTLILLINNNRSRNDSYMGQRRDIM